MSFEHLKRTFAVFLLITLFISSGCGINVNALNDFYTFGPVEHTPSPTPEPTPTPSEFDAQYAELRAAFSDAFRGDLLMINNYSLSWGYDKASGTIASVERYVLKEKLLQELLPQSAEAAFDRAKALFPQLTLTPKFELETPNWQYLASVLPLMDSAEDFLDALSPEFTINRNGAASELSITLSPTPIREFAQSRADLCADPQEAANTYIDIRFTYAYMTAVYDENGEEYANVTTREYSYPKDYAKELLPPLDNVPAFVDTWAQGRSNNTRKHMGTDLITDKGTPILSCSDGMVLYTGSANIPGNYVLIMDEHGFEYHYYHMRELSPLVKAGDKVAKGQHIGYVGNTGNSDVSHLHISIISPEGIFANPFRLITQVVKSHAG